MDAFKTSGLSPSIIAEAEPGDLPAIIGELHRLVALAYARLVSPATAVETNKATEPALLSVSDAARLVSLNPTALRRSEKFRSARRVLGPRSIRFDRDALLRIVRRAA